MELNYGLLTYVKNLATRLYGFSKRIVLDLMSKVTFHFLLLRERFLFSSPIFC